ncbi:MAG: GT4 family glycosyltransferase PelF [Actinobacteria bacterium]|nr:GT4 family glycosyltransferase PelF [Actinomycetota bacterium]
MKICLLLEGSYPYVTGGVSTWAQMLIRNMGDFGFILYTIGAEEKYRSKYKYSLPGNVLEIHEIFLDEMVRERGRYGTRYRLTEDISASLRALMTGDTVNWESIFEFVAKRRMKSELDFFMSRDFFDVLKGAYADKFKSVPFTEFFWTVRSMLVPLFFILNRMVPEADIYHSASNGYAGIVGAFGKYLYDKPFLLTEHGIYLREREEEIIKSGWAKPYFKDMWIRFFRNLCGCVYDYADQVFTLFEKNRDIEVELGCDKDKIRIVPNGIDVKELEKEVNNSVPAAEVRRNGLGFINIGSITRVVPIKDIKTMIYSFNQVKRAVPNARFFIMGPTDEDEEYFHECVRLVERLDLNDVLFTGRVDIKKYIGEIDILVLTSISEGQPFVILEGMACKKPFVCTDVGGCKELLYGRDDEFGRAGFIVPIMDVDKISRAIIRLCEDTDLRLEMGENGYRRVSSIYSAERCIETYRNIYKAFVSQLSEIQAPS